MRVNIWKVLKMEGCPHLAGDTETAHQYSALQVLRMSLPPPQK